MSESFQCPQGHRWELPLSGDAGTTSVEVKCPVCGQVGLSRRTDDAPAAASSESETIPPHPAAAAEAITDTHMPQANPVQAKSSGTCESSDHVRKSPDFRYGTTSPPNIPGYEILEPLGEGGMGQVYKARYLRLNRMVALKVIHPDYLSNPDAIRRFQREAYMTAQLNHQNLVNLYDVDSVAGTHFLVMEYVEGTDLGRLVKTQGVLPVAQACEYIRQAALALEHIHERGLVHRDIKPTNLFLTGNGTHIKVLDMGLARFNQPGPSDQLSAELTQPGAVMGTPAFLAPEQARDSRRVDIRSDIYSLGCTLYYLLTGRVPFPGIGLAEIVVQHQLDEPEAIEKIRQDVSPEVTAIVRKMMAKKPEDRYQTPADVAAALAPFCQLPGVAGAESSKPRHEVENRGFPSFSPGHPEGEPLTTGPLSSRSSPGIIPSTSMATELLPAPRSPRERTLGNWRLRRVLVFAGSLLALGILLIVGGSMYFGGCSPQVVYQDLRRTSRTPTSKEYQQAEEHNKRALARNPREYDAAIADLSKAIELAPDKPEYYGNRGQRYILRGQQNNTAEDYDKAIADYTEAIRLTPKMADFWNRRGWAYLNKEDWQKAMADIDEAIRLEPNWATCYSNRGWAYKIKGDYAAALVDFNKALELDPRHAPAFQLRGDLYLQQKNYDAAHIDFDEAIQIDPGYVAAYFGRGQAYLKMRVPERVPRPGEVAIPVEVTQRENLEKALADLNQAISLRPNFARAYLVRSEVYAKMKDEARSKADYLEAIRRDPKLVNTKK